VSIPLLDLRRWIDGAPRQRTQFAQELDQALQDSGFLLLTGHGVAADSRDDVRRAARRFFALPDEVRSRYATEVGGRGWIPLGREANSYAGVDADPERADMKESWVFGPAWSTGDAEIDATWFPPNVWPAEVPELEQVCLRYFDAVDDVFTTLLRVCAVALGLRDEWFVDLCRRATRVTNLNNYPAVRDVGTARPGQFRIAPHTDWGTLTLLDREPGMGGLEIEARDGTWLPAPFVEGALTVNVGDLMARWTGDRWRSTRHRVLPPPPAAPTEELLSIVSFYETDADALIETVPTCDSQHERYEPIVAADWIVGRYEAARV
jgi:isopenicillin N synthase-like dioxygenase